MENKYNLPYECFAILPSTNELIKVRFGEKGYYKLTDEFKETFGNEDIDVLNKQFFNVDRPTAFAMLSGSMFGWHVEGTNPEVWQDKDWVRN